MAVPKKTNSGDMNNPLLTNLFKTIESIAAQIVEMRIENNGYFKQLTEIKASMKTYEEKIEIIDQKLRESPIHREGVSSLINYLSEHYDSLKQVLKNHERVEELKIEGQRTFVNRVVIGVFSGAGLILSILITYFFAKGGNP